MYKCIMLPEGAYLHLLYELAIAFTLKKSCLHIDIRHAPSPNNEEIDVY